MSAATPITVADCQRVQTAWFVDLAAVAGGETWSDDGLTWIWQPWSSHVMLMFPERIGAAAVERGVQAIAARGARSAGAWLSTDVDPAPLVAAGFERGWAPWWMTARLADVPSPEDPRVRLEDRTPEYDAPDDVAQLALARHRPTTTWHAAARVDGRLVGHAWIHAVGDMAGVFDMGVWPRFQRQGLGSGLLRTICAAARSAGVRDAILNSTPAGERLYLNHGFRRIGEGITYWLHRD
jgi:GNAT superfamily N-acetyltransferase